MQTEILTEQETTFNVATHNGYITIENPQTGDHRTFRVWTETMKGSSEEKRIVSLLTAPDRESFRSWTGFGFAGDNGKISVWKSRRDHGPWTKYAALLERPADGERYGLICHVEGRCRVCNRPLSNPESVRSGIGPICAGR